MKKAPHPGEYIAHNLDHLSMTQSELSLRTGIVRSMLSQIIKGKRPVGPSSAWRLAFVLHCTSNELLKMQLDYNEANLPRETEDMEFLSRFPVKDWVKNGHLERGTTNEVLRFFQVGSVEAFDDFYGLKKNKTLKRVIIESLNR